MQSVKLVDQMSVPIRLSCFDGILEVLRIPGVLNTFQTKLSLEELDEFPQCDYVIITNCLSLPIKIYPAIGEALDESGKL